MVGCAPGGSEMEMRTLCREREVFSSSYSRLTVEVPESEEGQQLTVDEGARVERAKGGVSSLQRLVRERHPGYALEMGTTLSSVPVSLHLSTPRPCPTGNPFLPSLSRISPLLAQAFLSTLGCVLNCKSLDLLYDEGGGRLMSNTDFSGSEMRRSRSPLSARDEMPPSRLRERERCSRTTRWTLMNGEVSVPTASNNRANTHSA